MSSPTAQTDPRRNLKACTEAELVDFMATLGEKPYRARQIHRWIHRRGATDFAAMTDLSEALRAQLETCAELPRIGVERVQTSADGTRKFLFRLADGEAVESVWIPDEKRVTLCISSQAGCAMGCGFCLTGLNGFRRNLAAWEIVEQIHEVQRQTPTEAAITNIVMMGMGEPLANLNEVVPAVERMVDPNGLALAPRRVTVSTVGLVPQMAELGRRAPYVNLAVSLGAATDAVRRTLIPWADRHPLADLMAACRAFPLPPRRRVFFEYILLAGINDSPRDARALVKLLHGVRAKVNLMAYNPAPDLPYERPSPERVLAFQKVLSDAGIRALVRRSRGQDILAACGQLQGEVRTGAVPEKPGGLDGPGPSGGLLTPV